MCVCVCESLCFLRVALWKVVTARSERTERTTYLLSCCIKWLSGFSLNTFLYGYDRLATPPLSHRTSAPPLPKTECYVTWKLHLQSDFSVRPFFSEPSPSGCRSICWGFRALSIPLLSIYAFHREIGLNAYVKDPIKVAHCAVRTPWWWRLYCK